MEWVILIIFCIEEVSKDFFLICLYIYHLTLVFFINYNTLTIVNIWYINLMIDLFYDNPGYPVWFKSYVKYYEVFINFRTVKCNFVVICDTLFLVYLVSRIISKFVIIFNFSSLYVFVNSKTFWPSFVHSTNFSCFFRFFFTTYILELARSPHNLVPW